MNDDWWGARLDQPPTGRLRVYSLGFLRQSRIRRVLGHAGLNVSTGWPGTGDRVGVWGQRPVSARGKWVAGRTGAPLLTLEDGFLRSVYPGALGDPPLSLVLDDLGIYFDASTPSRLETILEEETCSTTDLHRARAGMAMLRAARLSKYAPPVPPQEIAPGFVLVVDQTAGDASIAGAGAGTNTFRRMLDAARAENPDKMIVIKTHPDVLAGKKTGCLDGVALRPNERKWHDPVNPWDLLEKADSVHTVSSLMGYEAILAGCRVRTFGASFYAGWGLSEDEIEIPRRTRRLSREDLFTGCHLRYPLYYDPIHDRLCRFEDTVRQLSAMVAHETPEADCKGEVFHQVRLWKRASMRRFRPRRTPVTFSDDLSHAADKTKASKRHLWIWASKVPTATLADLNAKGLSAGFVEDGFLRSVGLGAELTHAASLVFDRSGIYFDPATPSDLETLITAATNGAADLSRAKALRHAIVAARVTKYNVGKPAQTIRPEGQRVILVPGQVEDDASILRGCGDVRTNLGLLEATRAANPDAYLIYKPHPDVEAGLRAGNVPETDLHRLTDEIVRSQSAVDLIEAADAVWTLTSLMGFEALLRGKPVTCLGTPFYAGWGLTEDLGPPCPRRAARPGLDALVWAALIAYPRYVDPVTGLACPAEAIVERLASGKATPRAAGLSKLQGWFASQSWLWRR